MKIILLTFISALLLSSCSANYEYKNIKDVQKPEVIMLHKKSYQGGVYALTIICSGYINGNAKLILILNGEPYKTENLSGKIKFQWGGDWYSDSAEIRYEPDSVKEGKLHIKYIFRDL